MATILEKEFNAVFKMPINGFDAVFMDFEISGVKMLLGWAIWSGVFVMCRNSKNNDVVEKIKTFFEDEYLKNYSPEE
ncbi:MAG TPA: hypothetical protein ENN45_04135 [Bacteroidetes bacterium]|nr:hypothetical protein [Bacteroidota bacterium]